MILNRDIKIIEAILFANNCNPPLEQQEVLRQLEDIWRRYAVHT